MICRDVYGHGGFIELTRDGLEGGPVPLETIQQIDGYAALDHVEAALVDVAANVGLAIPHRIANACSIEPSACTEVLQRHRQISIAAID